jgi:hypothetical protein
MARRIWSVICSSQLLLQIIGLLVLLAVVSAISIPLMGISMRP